MRGHVRTRLQLPQFSSHPVRTACLLLVVFLFGASWLWAQAARIDDIRWEGLRRIPRDTMNARIFTKRGDPYNPDLLRRDFQAIWNTGFFDDVKLLVEDTEEGNKIVVFEVTERPLIRRIDYDGVKSATESEILEAFRNAKVGLTVESQYDPTRIRRAELVLGALLASRGRHFANVGHEIRRIPPNAVILTFVVDEGPKVKVGRINFRGNQVFGDRQLTRTMKASRPWGLIPLMAWHLKMPLNIHSSVPLPLFSHGKTFNEPKMFEDLERVRELYQEHGYFRAVVHEPRTRTRDTEPFLPLLGGKGKRIDIDITVEEGRRFRMGELKVESATGDDKDLFFRTEFLETIFPLQKGDLFNVTKIRKSLEDYRKLYSSVGFINATTIPETTIDDDQRIIDLSLDIDPGKQFFVRRIEFVGNTTTRDKVIRREIMLDEGTVFNSRLWELSVLRLNQLGYFEELKPENAEVEQNAAAGTVDLTLKVKERGRNSIGLTGGVSGLVGSFVGLNYQTNNFLGLGETLTFSVDYGDRTQNFLFGFTEPYFYDRPISTGFTFFVRKFEFDQAREVAILSGRRIDVSPTVQNQLLNFNQNTVGFTTFASYPLRRWSFTRLGVSYSFETSDLACFSDGCRNLFERLSFRGLAGTTNSLEGIRISRVTPTLFYNTVNHPFEPTGGTSLFLSSTIQGGPLGGNVNMWQPLVEFKHFHPDHWISRNRHTLAFRFLTGFLTGFGSKVAPPFNRFYLGGEDNIRGFDIRAVSPMAFIPVQSTLPVVYLDPTQLDPQGNPTVRLGSINVLSNTIIFPGGDAQAVANFEYRIPVAGPVSLALFFDTGITTVLRRSELRLQDAGLDELRTLFPGVQLPTELELVPRTNDQIRTSTGLEFVINLPIVNAPFRFYWAYNLHRLRTRFTVPAASFAEIPGFPLPPGVFDSQIQPQLGQLFPPRTFSLIEPLRSFRFTVSRTF
ncbi:MAG: outer membrane protein assembly factor BamA [Acidobacteria bacterium]|nr:outer membrane protein assembly factor BamA [Acidobacteriota bacterium]